MIVSNEIDINYGFNFISDRNRKFCLSEYLTKEEKKNLHWFLVFFLMQIIEAMVIDK